MVRGLTGGVQLLEQGQQLLAENNRLVHAGFLWAFSALQASSGANSHYRRRREHGDWHNAAQRHLLNRFFGQLHHCLQIQQHFDEQRAFAHSLKYLREPAIGHSRCQCTRLDSPYD